MELVMVDAGRIELRVLMLVEIISEYHYFVMKMNWNVPRLVHLGCSVVGMNGGIAGEGSQCLRP